MTFERTIDRKAQEIASELTNVGYGFDPTTIVAIITAIIQLFQVCNLSPSQAEFRAANPRLLDRLRLRRIIRQHSAGDEEALEAALLDAGNDLTAASVKAMYAELAA